MNSKLNFNILVLFLIAACTFVVYFSSIAHPAFYFDDHYSIESNELIKKINIPQIFNAFNTRFLVGFSFALNYKVGGLNPLGYRLINLLIHGLNAFLVFLMVRGTFQAKKNQWPAIFACFLFLLHPIQTEPVNFTTQRFVLLGTFFYLLTLFCYIQYRLQFKKRWMLIAVISATAAMFCKEFVITLPIMLVAYDIFFLPKQAARQRCKNLLPFFAIVLIVPFLLLKTSHEAVGVANIADSGTIQEDDSQKIGH